MVVFELHLPKRQDPDAFVKFMKEKYLPAVHMGQTRMGQVESLSLAQGRNEHAGEDGERKFLMLVGWSGIPLDQLPRLDNDEAKAVFEAFKPDVKRLGEFEDVAAWPASA